MSNISINEDINQFPLACIGELVFLQDKPQKSDIILIPGSEETQLIYKAIKLYNDGFAPLILISGGANQIIPKYSSEAEYFAKICSEQNISQNSIICETKAKNTFENAHMSYELIKEKNINIESVLLVVKEYHSRRALLTYKRYFSPNINFSVATVPGIQDITKRNWYLDRKKANIVMNEVVKIGQYFKTEILEFNGKFQNC